MLGSPRSPEPLTYPCSSSDTRNKSRSDAPAFRGWGLPPALPSFAPGKVRRSVLAVKPGSMSPGLSATTPDFGKVKGRLLWGAGAQPMLQGQSKLGRSHGQATPRLEGGRERTLPLKPLGASRASPPCMAWMDTRGTRMRQACLGLWAPTGPCKPKRYRTATMSPGRGGLCQRGLSLPGAARRWEAWGKQCLPHGRGT